VSAVLSGAAGYYAVFLEGDAEISTNLAVLFGQNLRISNGHGTSAIPGWGDGPITVQRGGALALSGVALEGVLTVQTGGNATISGGVIDGSARVEAGGTLRLMSAIILPSQINAVAGTVMRESSASGLASQCSTLAGRYTTLSDAYRATSAGPGTHGDCVARGPCTRAPCFRANGGTGVGGGGWYRFSGPGGDALPLHSPGENHCGTDLTGWLSGWDGTGHPEANYITPGHYPTAAEGVVEMTVCFDFSRRSGNAHCIGPVKVGVVMCDGFLLWRLPYAWGCNAYNTGYCTVASGL
jgi:hypothetical protein